MEFFSYSRSKAIILAKSKFDEQNEHSKKRNLRFSDILFNRFQNVNYFAQFSIIDTIKELHELDESVDTLKLLQAIFIHLYLNNEECTAPMMALLVRLLSRFEITGKLYAQYDPSIRRGQGAYENYETYALLSCCLINVYRATNSFKILNAVLKLNDLLSRILIEEEINDVGLILYALQEEEIEVLALYDRQGFSLTANK